MAIFPPYRGEPLLERLIATENMVTAWRQVKRNISWYQRGRSAGSDRVTLNAFEANLAHQLAALVEELRGGRYVPQPARRVAIPKGDGRERLIGILSIRDRIVQRALQQVLDPVFDPYFLDCSYGCRRSLNVQQALERVERYAAQGFTYVVDADISGYFDSLDHGLLLQLVRERVRELPMLQLIRALLEAGAISEAEAAPLPGADRGGIALLSEGTRAIRQGLERLRSGPLGGPGLPEFQDYDVGMWDDPGGWPDGPGQLHGPTFGSPLLQRPSPYNTLWSLYLLLRPLKAGARMALPHLQRLGPQRMAVAGAAAAGAVVLAELLLRWQGHGGRGAVQGGSLSPLLGNIYLHPFDLALTSQGLRLVRFMDDFVVMCASRGDAERAMTLVERQLAVFRLALNPEKTRIVDYADGLEFLGQALAPPKRGPGLLDGVTSFEEAQARLSQAQAQLKAAARKARGRRKGGKERSE